MKRFLLTLFVACILSVYVVSHAYGQARQVKYDDYCIVLITSAQCGYCIVNTGWFNSLADKYSDDIQMVALSESKQKTIDKLKAQFPDRDVTLKGWELIPNARHLISKLVEQETYPQIILLEKGKVKKRFVGTIQSVKDAVEEAIPLFVSEKKNSEQPYGA